MPEAVIAATARSPIGRAVKGSLRDLRPDDLGAAIIQALLARVPEIDPSDIDDLLLGCGLPGGEQGFNLARGSPSSLVLCLLPTNYANGHARDQGRRGGGLHLRRRRVCFPLRSGATATVGRAR